MSAAAAWANTAFATLWARASRDGWSGALSFAAPVTFTCDYKAEAKRMNDAKGEEFISALLLYTERSDIEPGDRVMLGTSTATDPIAAGAREVRAVNRYNDTFQTVAARKVDDFEVATV